MSGQDLLMHVDLVARKEWIEMEKEKEKMEFLFKWGEGRKIKGKGENQSIGAKCFPLNSLYD